MNQCPTKQPTDNSLVLVYNPQPSTLTSSSVCVCVCVCVCDLDTEYSQAERLLAAEHWWWRVIKRGREIRVMDANGATPLSLATLTKEEGGREERVYQTDRGGECEIGRASCRERV